MMALERVPALTVRDGGIIRASDQKMIKDIQAAVNITVMAKFRKRHIAEARILEALEVDCIDESEVLTTSDAQYHIDKLQFKIPFFCGCRNLGEALRRIHEGASLISCKGHSGTGNIAEAVKHLRALKESIEKVSLMNDKELTEFVAEERVSFELGCLVRESKKLPVPFFAACGVATPADAAL